MQKIKEVFDPSKDIYRKIEKVVTFGNLDNDYLKREISEYVVTEKLKQNFQKIFDALQSGMDSESHEIGIWVSGFYGSGKSSFAKYFGLALDKSQIVDGISFQERLSNRINSTPIVQQLKTIIAKNDPAIFLIDLATQQISGYELAPVGTILYNEVMKIAGYAKEAKISLLERKLEMDGKLKTFKQQAKDIDPSNMDWDELKFKDVLAAKSIASQLAPKFYPAIWKDERAYNIIKIDDIENDRERTIQMLELIKKKTSKENVLFIVDEVGQYISAKDDLILQMQGTMQNLKDIGKGKAWLLATAQQTLTEDNPNARYNSDKLYKLNDRFPIKIDIEASDIKEITTQRLLGKSPDGAKTLSKLFAQNGEKLRICTRLSNVDRTIYKAELDEPSFINLYPFLPHHFNLLLSLLGRLAKKTGGIGLRSAIRVIQDVLTDRTGDQLAEIKIGTLATTVHIFNVLKSDIKKSYPHVVAAVDKVTSVYGESSVETHISKSIATLQILDDFHLSVENLAVMMHPSVDSSSKLDEIKTKVDGLKATPGLTLKEIDGQLKFMTDAIIRIEKEKDKISVSGPDTRRIMESQVEDLFTPVPTARVLNTKTVKTGIQLVVDERPYKLLEQNEEIQTELHFILRDKYDNALERIKHSSTEKINENRIYFLGIIDEPIDKTLDEIVRCEGIYGTRNRYDDKEISDYLRSQFDEAEKLKQIVKRELGQSLESGEFIFRGASKPAKQLGDALREAANAQLKIVADKVYHKYGQASQNMESSSAYKLLQYDDLRSVSPVQNPFGLIKSDGSIDISAPALKSIEDFLQKEGQVDGRKLLDHFNEAEYGWHKDTSRYLVAVMFISSRIKLRIAGEWVKVKGPTAIEKLSNSTGFNQIGISLYNEGQPTHEQTLIASQNLTELLSHNNIIVPPLPQKISEIVLKNFPDFQRKYAAIKKDLENLSLPGTEKAEAIQDGIVQILKGDASDATFRLGKKDAELYLALKWAKQVHDAFENNIGVTIKELNHLKSEIDTLPTDGLIGELKKETKSNFDQVDRILSSETFYEKAPELKELLAEIQSSIASSCESFQVSENQRIKVENEKIKQSYNWKKLKEENKKEISDRLERALIKDKEGIKGIRETINEAYSFNNLVNSTVSEIESIIISDKDTKTGKAGTKQVKIIKLNHLPRRIEKPEDIDSIIETLEDLKKQLGDNQILDLNW
ncbi:MAG TPA: BREX system P-loop protein BrxC [Prolixibacteraceae bacterium]|nr:BREX system P-loop protein BrxC [Prolixibacteraceae bacterium]